MKIEIPIEIVFLQNIKISDERTDLEDVVGKEEQQEIDKQQGCHLFIECSFNEDIIANLVIDTGASKTVFDKELTQDFVEIFTLSDDILSSGVNANMDMEFGKVNQLFLGNHTFENIMVGLTNLEHINLLYQKMAGKTIWGLLGSDFMFAHKAVIDYRNGKMILEI